MNKAVKIAILLLARQETAAIVFSLLFSVSQVQADEDQNRWYHNILSPAPKGIETKIDLADFAIPNVPPGKESKDLNQVEQKLSKRFNLKPTALISES